MRHVILAILLIGLPAASIAAPAPAETQQFKKCMAAGDTTANKTHQWAACWDDELGCQDAILNVTYKKVQASATPEVRDLLVEGQRVWLAYREAWCRYETSSPMPLGHW